MVLEKHRSACALNCPDICSYVVHIEEGKVTRIEGDPDLVRQSLRNLLNNAIKYAPDSGPVTVSAKLEEDVLVICVEDRGPGIPEHERSRVFEMFYRSPNARVANRKGKGLGLAFVRSTAERHGGKAWCESQLGKGSAFYIALPVVQEPALEMLD